MKKSRVNKAEKELDSILLREMKGNPDKLATYATFCRFVIDNCHLDYTVDALRYHVKNVAAANNIKFGGDIKQSVDQDLEKYRVTTDRTDLQRSYKSLVARHVALTEQMDDLLDLDAVNYKALQVERSAAALEHQGVPIMQWSDWHVEKRIDSAVMNGLNEYNPDIAKARALKLFDNTLKMIELHRSHVEITQGIIHMGGDAIEGYLREHNLRENYLTPIEASIFASELEITGLEAMLASGYFKTLFVLFNRGNHPRLTKKMDSDDHRMNYETFIHHAVVKHFRNDQRIQFVVPTSDLGYFDIMDKRIRFFHGHQIQYNGGLGGVTIPLRKAVMNWDMTTQADENLLGHFHQSYKPLQNAMMNGSLCGYDPFAMSVVKAPYQAPYQSMEMLIEGRGFRMFTSIDCE